MKNNYLKITITQDNLLYSLSFLINHNKRSKHNIQIYLLNITKYQ